MHRIRKAITTLAEIAPSRKLCVARELTKKFETIYRGTAAEILESMKESETKGEFVIVADRVYGSSESQ